MSAERLIREISDLSNFEVKARDMGMHVSVNLYDSGTHIGHIWASEVDIDRMHSKVGKDTISAIQKGLGSTTLYSISGVEIEKDYRGQGIGQALYIAVLKMVDKKDGWLVSDLFGSTSSQAQRTWTSLSKYASTVKKVPTLGNKVVWAAKGAK